MSDPVERRSLVPRGTFATQGAKPTTDITPGDPLESYVRELRARVEEADELDEALTVPPGAPVVQWVASDLETALTAAAETVPRHSPAPGLLAPVPSNIPPVTPRRIRRPEAMAPDRFPVELEGGGPLLKSNERGKKSGRFVAPGKLAAAEPDGSIANVVRRLVEAERGGRLAQPELDRVLSPEPIVVSPPPLAVEPVAAAVESLAVPATVSSALASAEPPATIAVPSRDVHVLSETAGELTRMQAHVADVSANASAPRRPGSTLRGVALFVTAWLAGAGIVYSLLHS